MSIVEAQAIALLKTSHSNLVFPHIRIDAVDPANGITAVLDVLDFGTHMVYRNIAQLD